MTYKTIIFDFGGVLYNINYHAATQALAKLSTKPGLFESMPLNIIFDLPGEFEKGNITAGEFRNFLRSEYAIEGTDEMIDIAWNAMLLGIKPESFDFIKSLKGKYKLALLSNTNTIHYDYFIPECKELIGLFDHVVLSYNTGLRKPDMKIYDYTLKKINANASESLFIDDSEVNLRGAEKLGLKVFHFTDKIKLSDLLHTI
jgi:glucose-1-phosphatase